MHGRYRIGLICLTGLLNACTVFFPRDLQTPATTVSAATLTPRGPSAGDLEALPAAKAEIPVAVYRFRDMTGQYKEDADSPYSSVMTQGGAILLSQSLLDSRWFVPMERDGLQNLLTERRIARTGGDDLFNPGSADLPPVTPATLVLEGAITGYDSEVRNGGLGARYYGAGLGDQYSVDQVSVELRAIDVRSGLIVASVSTTKTIYSSRIQGNFFRFVRFKRLLEAEAGVTQNEPRQLALQDAIDAAVVKLIALGLHRGYWALRYAEDQQAPVLNNALTELGLSPLSNPQAAR